MQRLVYSPQVKAMVRTNDGILDISDYIVSGSVNRVLNEVSTAELVIRNPHKKFTTPGNPTFRPMDDIQIWGSRYREHPVQLFTGYLDTTPYLQLFPGTCTLQASCTLKRLLHTYWDPGLPYVWQWLSKWGWLPNPQTGEIFSSQQFQASGINSNNGVSQREVENALLTDGSIGNLLFNFLVDIGNWKGSKDPKDSQVLIEKLPDGIITTVSNLMQQYQKDDAETAKEVQQFFSDMIGQYSGGGSVGTSTGTGNTGSAGDISGPGITSAYAQFSQIVAAKIGLSLCVVGAWCLAEGGPSYNPLNIGPGNTYSSVEAGAKATIDTLHNGLYGVILNSVNKSDHDQMQAILDSPWGTVCCAIFNVYPSLKCTSTKAVPGHPGGPTGHAN